MSNVERINVGDTVREHRPNEGEVATEYQEDYGQAEARERRETDAATTPAASHSESRQERIRADLRAKRARMQEEAEEAARKFKAFTVPEDKQEAFDKLVAAMIERFEATETLLGNSIQATFALRGDVMNAQSNLVNGLRALANAEQRVNWLINSASTNEDYLAEQEEKINNQIDFGVNNRDSGLLVGHAAVTAYDRCTGDHPNGRPALDDWFEVVKRVQRRDEQRLNGGNLDDIAHTRKRGVVESLKHRLNN